MNSEVKKSKREIISVGDKIIYLIDKGWVIPIYRVIYSICIGLLGIYIGIKGFDLLAGLLIIIFLLIFSVIEFLLGKSSDSIKEKTRLETMESVNVTLTALENDQNELEFKMALSSKTSSFLSGQIQRTIRTLNHLLSAAAKGELPQSEWVIKKKRIVENTLERMCLNFISITSKKFRKTEADVMFRSTYMTVDKLATGEEVLNYYAWFTPGGHQPRSASLGIFYRKGEGVAGIAWQRERVVIEDVFKNFTEWRDNYPGQGELYGSMTCIPVFTCTIHGKDDVIGIITIDTNLKGFFGHKDDKVMEDKISNWVRPYADYIAFTSIMAEIIKEFTEPES
jgi:hypothetical protein